MIAGTKAADTRDCTPGDMYECVHPTTEEYVNEDLQADCDCPQQCDQTLYRPFLSFAKASDAALAFTQKYIYPHLDLKDMDDQFVMLDIFYPDLTYHERGMMKSYEVLAFFCDIGGALGLALGSTILTLCEILDFCFVSVWSRLTFKSKKRVNR